MTVEPVGSPDAVWSTGIGRVRAAHPVLIGGALAPAVPLPSMPSTVDVLDRRPGVAAAAVLRVEAAVIDDAISTLTRAIDTVAINGAGDRSTVSPGGSAAGTTTSPGAGPGAAVAPRELLSVTMRAALLEALEPLLETTRMAGFRPLPTVTTIPATGVGALVDPAAGPAAGPWPSASPSSTPTATAGAGMPSALPAPPWVTGFDEPTHGPGAWPLTGGPASTDPAPGRAPAPAVARLLLVIADQVVVLVLPPAGDLAPVGSTPGPRVLAEHLTRQLAAAGMGELLVAEARTGRTGTPAVVLLPGPDAPEGQSVAAWLASPIPVSAGGDIWEMVHGSRAPLLDSISLAAGPGAAMSGPTAPGAPTAGSLDTADTASAPGATGQPASPLSPDVGDTGPVEVRTPAPAVSLADQVRAAVTSGELTDLAELVVVLSSVKDALSGAAARLEGLPVTGVTAPPTSFSAAIVAASALATGISSRPASVTTLAKGVKDRRVLALLVMLGLAPPLPEPVDLPDEPGPNQGRDEYEPADEPGGEADDVPQPAPKRRRRGWADGEPNSDEIWYGDALLEDDDPGRPWLGPEPDGQPFLQP